MNDIKLSLGSNEDMPAIQMLLAECHLSCEAVEWLAKNCIVAKAGSKLVGTVALEPFGRLGLLRSLAVRPSYRGQSVGRNLCTKMTSHARLLGVEELYLLTIDREPYLSKLGFQRLQDSEIPLQIRKQGNFVSSARATLFA